VVHGCKITIRKSLVIAILHMDLEVSWDLELGYTSMCKLLCLCNPCLPINLSAGIPNR
jgi:hypothetical protein